MMLNKIGLIVFLAIFMLTLAEAFHGLPSSSSHPMRMTTLKMIFGKKAAPAAAKKTVEIIVDRKVITSSEASVNLRKTLMANGVDVYPLKAKITGNCGGAGICGTCAVKVISGMENISPASKNEQNTLRNRPADQRLSCCAKVSGPITIQTKP
eukprot:scaffold3532_cov182-Ochromonas_danica.AAC.10